MRFRKAKAITDDRRKWRAPRGSKACVGGTLHRLCPRRPLTQQAQRDKGQQREDCHANGRVADHMQAAVKRGERRHEDGELADGWVAGPGVGPSAHRLLGATYWLLLGSASSVRQSAGAERKRGPLSLTGSLKLSCG